MSEAIEVSEASPEYARGLTDRIKVAVEGTWHLIVEAYKSRSWAALGYTSWDDYCTREFGNSRLRLPREERQDHVASLRESGLSIRAITAATGIADRTVQRDIKAGVVNDYTSPEPPAPALSDEPGQVSKLTGPNSAATVTGMDGKTYTRPEPKPSTYFDAETGEVATGDIAAPKEPAKPRRRPITDRANEAGWELRKTTEKIQRIYEDDRFSSNKEQVATHLRGHLQNTVKVCQDLLDQIN